MGGLNYFARMAPVATGIAALLVLAAGGCGGHSLGDPPELHPATGKVVSAQGAAMTEGMIEFRSTTDAQQSARGNVQSDGRFSLETIWGREKLPGAAVGEYEVTYYPAMGNDQKLSPVTLRESFKVEAKENELEIDLGATAPGSASR